MKLSVLTGKQRVIVDTQYEAALTETARDEENYSLIRKAPTTLREIVAQEREAAGDDRVSAVAEIILHECTGRWKYEPEDERVKVILDEPIEVYQGRILSREPHERCAVYLPSYWQ